MNLINAINTLQDLLSLRDHVGKILSAELSIPLKPRKLNELTARLIGAADFNTAQAIVANKKTEPAFREPINIVLDVTNGDNLIYCDHPIRGVIIDSSVDEVMYSLNNKIPNVFKDAINQDFVYWTMADGGNVLGKEEIDCYIAQANMTNEPEPQFPAIISSDDQLSEAHFNAYHYFKSMSVEAVAAAITKLDSEGWADGWIGGYASDAIAEALRSEPGFDQIDWVFDYIDSVNDNNERLGLDRDQGFTVSIDPGPVKAWFKSLSGI